MAQQRRKKVEPRKPWYETTKGIAAVIVTVAAAFAIFSNAIQAGWRHFRGAEVALQAEPIVQQVPPLIEEFQAHHVQQAQINDAVARYIEQSEKAVQADRLQKKEERKAREEQTKTIYGLCKAGKLDRQYCVTRFPEESWP